MKNRTLYVAICKVIVTTAIIYYYRKMLNDTNIRYFQHKWNVKNVFKEELIELYWLPFCVRNKIWVSALNYWEY